MSNPSGTLKEVLGRIISRQRRLAFWSKLAVCWAGAAFLGLVVIFVEKQSGWASSLTTPIIAALGIIAAIVVLVRHGKQSPDLRSLAKQVEARHPELEGRLLTAVQQPFEEQQLNFLQQRLVEETLTRGRQADWAQVVPRSRLLIAQGAHWLALVLLGLVLWSSRVTSGPALLARIVETGITVTPGDAQIERGNSLVVFVKFAGPLPSNVELVIGSHRMPLNKSLADPIFGGSIAEVSTNFAYRIEYAGRQTRDFQVTVFEYPRLERPDVELTFPDYTAQPLKRVENTRRVTAVEGSRLDLALQLNKAVAAASLIARDKTRSVIALNADTNRAFAVLTQFPLEKSQTYDLQLIDFEGRTNKVPAQFVFDVLTNRVPEFRLASPRGDLRPSPLEEISFEGTVWDDFGLQAYGLGYSIPGEETKYLEMGKLVTAKEKKTFQYSLHLEDLRVEPDQLVSWFLWADDVGPDGQVRRSTGDLFFGEVRPFEEVFRAGQGMEGGQQGGQQGMGQSPTAKLTELQKQIISATWKLRREHGGVKASSDQKSTNSLPGRESRFSVPRPTQKVAQLLPSAMVSSRLQVFGQPARDSGPGSRPAERSGDSPQSNKKSAPTYSDDATVVRDSQAQALEQTQEQETGGRSRDAKARALWSTARKEMEKALENLEKARNSPVTLAEALAAEQAAYQALLRLQQHEYQVMRNQRNQQGGGGGSRDQQMQRQLEQMDLAKEENRYETQRQAQRPQNTEQREQLQVQNRLQELARRQQDLNDRLKELQTALQEAKTEEEREEIRRRLKRLQEEEQQMLNDVDELRQRMERPENQSRMADERKQLDETRKDVQQAADAASQGSASQALASGTRAQRQLQELRDQIRKENSSQFSEELRQMRSEARELSRRQEEILKSLQADNSPQQRSLSDSTNRQIALEQLARQQQRMTNLLDRATEVSQAAEEAEPIVSRQLYDSVRKFAQDSANAVKQTQEELLSRGLMTRGVYDRLQDPTLSDGTKLLQATSELLKQDLNRPAGQTAERTRSTLDNLKRGVERAAESVLGDDTEALRLAQQEIDRLTEELRREINEGQGIGQTNQPGQQARAGANGSGDTNMLASANGREGQRSGAQNSQSGSNQNQPGEGQPSSQQNASNEAQASNSGSNNPSQNNSTQNQQTQADSQQANNQQSGGQPQSGRGQGNDAQANANNNNNGQPSEQSSQQASNQSSRDQQGRSANRSQAGGTNRRWGGVQNDAGGGGDGGDISGSLNQSIDRLFNDPNYYSGPITGEDFAPWSDRLRDIEEMVDVPELRDQVARVRERARGFRQEYKRDLKKPDWAVVRMQVMKPLLQVRDQIADELARRENSDPRVPIDRDPVPNRYSDLVRGYFEELGKEK